MNMVPALSPEIQPATRILIVDDREENLFVLEELLSSMNVEVVKALSGSEALHILIKDSDFCLILMDVQMPVLDGFKTTQLIHKHPKTRHTPVIFITAIHKDIKYIHEGFDSGAADYICKPIDAKILLAKVQIFIDLEKNKRALEELLEKTQALEESKNLLLKCSLDGIIAVDENGLINFCNPAAQQILRADSNRLMNKSILMLLDRPALRDKVDWENSIFRRAILQGDTIRENDAKIANGNGRYTPCSYSFGTFRSGDKGGGVLMFHDISQRKQNEEKLLHMATHDPLTKLPNRMLFKEAINNAINRCKRNGHRLIVMFVDLDHFKKVNDEFGHTVGDELLVNLAHRLRSYGRKVNLFARLGGDEFGVLFEDENGNFDSSVMAGKMLEVFSKPIEVKNHSILTSGSIGIVEFPEYGEDADSLIKAADITMYQAKNMGRNCFAMFDPKYEDLAVQRSQLERDFKKAVLDDELSCHFQPIIDSHNEKLVAVEVLARWKHESRGFVSPDNFIPIAEKSGLIIPMSLHIYTKAFEALQNWKDKGIWPEGARIALNTSSVQFRNKLVIDQLFEIKERFGLDLDQFEIEITESLLLNDQEEVIETLRLMQTMGLSISIDDFGTGYSSLSYLRRLPINTLKIDRSFIKDIGRDKDDECIISATIDLAHNLNLKVISEGVETEEHAAFLRRADSDYFQGYLYSRPLPEKEMEDWLTSYTEKFKEA
ncbi:EAL domain-containing protein [Parasalinivibrio latis]|uniref:two-component system response regulator n=1 Tax=Parasalinivibrio latis TaxID=2952610 RepID=UPI0030DF47D7